MDPVQLALIILGLVAIAGGVLALIAAIWTLRARPTRSARHAEPPPFARREPTLDRSEQISRAASSSPPHPAEPASGLESGLSNSKMDESHDEDEDDIPTTVLSASAFADLDDMMAAIDDLDSRDSS